MSDSSYFYLFVGGKKIGIEKLLFSILEFWRHKIFFVSCGKNWWISMYLVLIIWETPLFAYYEKTYCMSLEEMGGLECQQENNFLPILYSDNCLETKKPLYVFFFYLGFPFNVVIFIYLYFTKQHYLNWKMPSTVFFLKSYCRKKKGKNHKYICWVSLYHLAKRRFLLSQ